MLWLLCQADSAKRTVHPGTCAHRGSGYHGPGAGWPTVPTFWRRTSGQPGSAWGIKPSNSEAIPIRGWGNPHSPIRLGIGVSSFVSLGDKYEVSGNGLLQWWEGDGTTDLALLHLESFGNPRAFSRTARRVARRMPVLTVDAGRSDAGRRAAASHTAAAATPTMTRQALFTQAGVIATRTVGEIVSAILFRQRFGIAWQ